MLMMKIIFRFRNNRHDEELYSFCVVLDVSIWYVKMCSSAFYV